MRCQEDFTYRLRACIGWKIHRFRNGGVDVFLEGSLHP